jgi:hypothetical protein
VERIEQSNQIDAIFKGELAVPDAHPDVQTWFELAVYNLAMQIVKAPAEKRKDMAGLIDSAWRDDVLPLARKLVKEKALCAKGE